MLSGRRRNKPALGGDYVRIRLPGGHWRRDWRSRSVDAGRFLFWRGPRGDGAQIGDFLPQVIVFYKQALTLRLPGFYEACCLRDCGALLLGFALQRL